MPHQTDDLKYSVGHRKEIISILDGLKKGRAPINLNTVHGDGFITSVLGINSEKNHVYLDISRDERVNLKVADSNHVTFTAKTSILVTWHSTRVNLIKLSDGMSLCIPIPEAVQRIQRREYFRLPLPQGSKGMVCKIPVLDEILEVPIKDMSAGGIGIVLTDPLHPAFSQGAILEGCNITFPEVGVVCFKLKICGTRVFQKTKGGANMHHVGMEFTDLSRGASNVVQRYMIQLEAENININSDAE